MISYTGRNRETVNYLKALYFGEPEWTPFVVKLMPATWMKYREDLEELVLAHPRVFPGYKKGDRDFDALPNPLYELGQHTDCWGIVWNNIEEGLDSIPVVHPLENWDAFDGYTPPDPMCDDQFGPRDWGQLVNDMAAAKAQGGIARANPLPHGFMYMLLYYLRGFENLMLDMATDDPRLHRLIAIVEAYNVAVIQKALELGAELIAGGEDLGLQHGLPISPAMWRKYIKPTYEAMYGPCRDAGIPVYEHTDGYILDIIPDLIEVGVRILNPQIRANGLDGLQQMAKGKVCVHLDLDRQMFPFATPSEIEDHIVVMHEGMYLPEGGLMLHAEAEPDVTLEQIDAICTTLEKVCNSPLM